MKNKNLLVLVWVILLSLFAESAAAFPKLQIQPIDLLGYVGKSLRISVTVPCGGEFVGLEQLHDYRSSRQTMRICEPSGLVARMPMIV